MHQFHNVIKENLVQSCPTGGTTSPGGPAEISSFVMFAVPVWHFLLFSHYILDCVVREAEDMSEWHASLI